MKQFSTTIYYNSIPELKDQLIQLHGQLEQPSGEIVKITRQATEVEELRKPSFAEGETADHGTVVPDHVNKLGNATVSTVETNLSVGSSADVAETDIQGVPHDSRIHSSGKTKTKSGQWTKRKGISEDVYNQITQELLSNSAPAQLNGPIVPPVPVSQAPATEASPVLSVVPPLISEPVQTQMITVNVRGGSTMELTPEEHQKFQKGVALHDIIAQRNAVVTAPPPPPTITSSVPVYDFQTFHGQLPVVLSKLFNDKVLTAEIMQQLASELQVPQLFLIQSDQTKSQQLFDKLSERGLIQKLNF